MRGRVLRLIVVDEEEECFRKTLGSAGATVSGGAVMF
jgi:hypothetical protein